MRKTSAGILMFKRDADVLLVLLAHPGGPFWKNRDDGAWTIPKGELDIDENPADAARREFEEEMGVRPGGDLVPLGEITQKGGKARDRVRRRKRLRCCITDKQHVRDRMAAAQRTFSGISGSR